MSPEFLGFMHTAVKTCGLSSAVVVGQMYYVFMPLF